MNRKYIFLLFCCFIGITRSTARELELLEDSIASFHAVLSKSKNDSVSQHASDQMRRLFIESFDENGAFEYPFSKLQFSTIASSDGKVRLFNWNQPFRDGQHKYYCFVLRKEEKDARPEWFELFDYPKEADKVENKYLNADKWIGALYYQIIPLSEKKNNDTYIVLGWDGKDDLTTRKMMDAIVFTGKKIRLGAPIFPGAMGNQKRMIFEYSNEVSMSVKYYDRKKCIVVDHLAPKSSFMTGVFADYGPDGSYDLYQLEKGKFVLYENIDVRDFSAEDDKPYYDPRPNQRRR